MTTTLKPTHCKRNAGIAIDEILLVSVMMGGLGTFGAVAVPWDSVMGTSTEQKSINELHIIEAANAEFHKLYKHWPHEMTNGKGVDNVAVLINRQALRYPYSHMEDFRSVTQDIMLDIAPNGTLKTRHSLGSGRILQRAAPHGSGYKMEIVLENIPLTTAGEIDKQIDGELSASSGRVFMDIKGNTAHIIYRANKI